MTLRQIFGLTFLLAVFSPSAFALDVAWEGYFRTRGNFHYNLQMNRNETPKVRAYSDLRFRLNPTFFISDRARVRTSINFFDGVLGDNPFRSGSYNNPAQTSHRLIDTGGSLTSLGHPSNTLSPQGSVLSPEGYTDSADLTAIRLRRVWGEFDIPYGTIKVGRMPNHFGLGIFANAGDSPDQEWGSSRDRIMFDTSFGSYYVRPGMGWLVEGALDRARDDFMEYFFIFGRKTESQDIGFYLSYNSQNRSTDGAGAEGANLKTSFWAFDFFIQNSFDPVDLSTEVVLISGKTSGNNILAINAAARAEFNLSPQWRLLVEPGYSSGTSESDFANGDIKSFAFSKDYDVSLLVFEEALPGGPVTRDSTGAATGNVSTAPHSGAISNAIYGRLKLSYDAASFFKPAINVVVPFAAKVPAEAGGRLYGVEYDILTRWPITPYWSAQFDFGHFIPMSFYDKVSRSHSTVVVRGGLTATF